MIQDNPFISQLNIFGCGMRQTLEHISHKDEQRQCYCTDQRRHPESINLKIVDHKETETLCQSGTEHNTYSQQAGQHIRNLTSFDKAEDHAPHTTQRKSVDKHGQSVVRSAQQSEKEQGHLGQNRRRNEKTETLFPFQLGNDLDAKELGYQITQNLNGGHRHLIIDSEKVHSLKGSRCIRFAERIYERIGK